ncbi:putative anthocyanidin 3-O-glucoside 2''-O-glucosyltransferase [Medicago truncatula]|uniref:Putative anthocyanidin 3-O-glucoside 2''-O-glucosyltransferase n=1 Tax=Medicago truncatula TaxID=3880 RepID=A0A396IAL7_MEDTR|nr:putative anthocyanidin 3-O-glucoside 2''-O-glucosyltransferase [Medicago truncatula]
MYPLFAMGHLTAFLHLANKLAKKGHKITFFTPKSAQSKLEPFNLHSQSQFLMLKAFLPMQKQQLMFLTLYIHTS